MTISIDNRVMVVFPNSTNKGGVTFVLLSINKWGVAFVFLAINKEGVVFVY